MNINKLKTSIELITAYFILLIMSYFLDILFTQISFSYAHIITSSFLYLFLSIIIFLYWEGGSLNWANRITLFRCLIIFLLSPDILFSTNIIQDYVWISLAFLAITLDGVDGLIARKYNCESRFGARFDMEMDAFFILVLSFAVLSIDRLGAWILLIGFMRYIYVLLSYKLEWLNTPTPPRFSRKVIAVWQMLSLLLILLPEIPQIIAFLIGLSAILSLIWSFGVDAIWQYRSRLKKIS